MTDAPAPTLQEGRHPMSISWRGGQAYLILLAVVSLIAAGWIQGYWSRVERHGAQRAKLAERLPDILRDQVARHGIEGAVESPAMALWLYGPIALPLVAVASGLGVLAIRRRNRWALVATVLVALASFPVAYGGTRVLRSIEDHHYYAKSPYVRTYRALSIPLIAGSAALLAAVSFEGCLLLRRRVSKQSVGTP
jgi:hypothetical protein